MRHLFAHLNDPNENGLLGEIQINGFQLRFLNESNLFDLDELKRAPWSFEDALLGVDKMGVFMEVEEESGELKVREGWGIDCQQLVANKRIKTKNEKFSLKTLNPKLQFFKTSLNYQVFSFLAFCHLQINSNHHNYATLLFFAQPS